MMGTPEVRKETWIVQWELKLLLINIRETGIAFPARRPDTKNV